MYSAQRMVRWAESTSVSGETMSHVVAMKGLIKSLAVAKAVAKRLGGELKEGQKTYRWYGRWMDDYSKEDAAYKQGIATENYGKCDHAIVFPGCNYDVGLVWDAAQQAYTLVWDYVDHNLKEKLGGTGAEKFRQVCNIEAAKAEARRRGLNCREVQGSNGHIQLIVDGK